MGKRGFLIVNLILILFCGCGNSNSNLENEKLLAEKEKELLKKEKELLDKQNEILLDKKNSTKPKDDSVAKPKPISSNLDFLVKYNNRGVNESKLFQNDIFIGRLRKMLSKSELDFLISYWNMEYGIMIKNNVFIAEGTPYQCVDQTGSIITYNFSSKVLSVGIREGSQVKIYSEDGYCPQPISDWVNREY